MGKGPAILSLSLFSTVVQVKQAAGRRRSNPDCIWYSRIYTPLLGCRSPVGPWVLLILYRWQLNWINVSAPLLVRCRRAASRNRMVCSFFFKKNCTVRDSKHFTPRTVHHSTRVWVWHDLRWMRTACHYEPGKRTGHPAQTWCSVWISANEPWFPGLLIKVYSSSSLKLSYFSLVVSFSLIINKFLETFWQIKNVRKRHMYLFFFSRGYPLNLTATICMRLQLASVLESNVLYLYRMLFILR